MVAGGDVEGGRAVPGPGVHVLPENAAAPSDSAKAVPPSMEIVSPWYQLLASVWQASRVMSAQPAALKSTDWLMLAPGCR